MIEPKKQNHYPDFTLMHNEEDQEKIALDVKTTYREEGQSKFQYTLGSYTSYIHPETRGKNIGIRAIIRFFAERFVANIVCTGLAKPQ